MRHRDKRYSTATRVLSHFDMDRSSSHSTAILNASNHKEEEETKYKDGLKVVYQQSLMELDEAIASVRYLCKFRHEPEWSSLSPNLIPTCNDSANDYGKQSLAERANVEFDIDTNTEEDTYAERSLHTQQSVASHSLRSSIKSKLHDRSDWSVDGHSSKRSTRSIRFHDNQLSSMENTSDGRSVFSRRSYSSSSAWSLSKSQASTRSSRSTRSLRSQRRKELELVRTARLTLLKKLKTSNSKTEISTSIGERDKPNQYSTSDILLDLEETIPTLLAEELSRLSLHSDKQDVNTGPDHIDSVDPEGGNTPFPPLQSVSGNLDSSRVDDNTYLIQKHPMNMLPPLVESVDDDAAWLQSRAEEPIWVDIDITQKMSTATTMKTYPFVSDDKNCDVWPSSSFKDEWEFDEMVFPTATTYSTADVISASAVQVEAKPNPFDAPTIERSKEPNTKANKNTRDILKDSGSPHSVIQQPYHLVSVSSTKKSLPIPPLGIDSLYSPPASFLLPESAWIRRLNQCRRDRMTFE